MAFEIAKGLLLFYGIAGLFTLAMFVFLYWFVFLRK